MDVSWMKPMIDRIESNCADIAYTYMQLYNTGIENTNDHDVAGFIQDKEAENKELLLAIRQRIDNQLQAAS